MTLPCACAVTNHAPRLIVLTGGPGAGKTAVLEIIRRHFCEHVAVLPEAASIIFGGGFPRRPTMPARCASQMAIFAVQRQLERLAIDEKRAGVALCDRGTLDGLAYWPLDDGSFFAETGTTRARELARYAAVIHLRTPTASQGYDHRNPVRTESALEAATIDARIIDAWRDHPHRAFVESTGDFLEKAAHAIALVRAELPACCRAHPVSLSPASSPASSLPVDLRDGALAAQ